MEKRRCGGCIYLNKLKKDGVLCSESGKNKGCPACKYWEPDIEGLSLNVRAIINFLSDCELSDVPVLEWVLKKQQRLLENPKSNPLLRIGRIVWHLVSSTNLEERDTVYQIRIQNVTAKHAVGQDLQFGTCFFLPLDSKVYTSRENLIKDQERIAKLKSQTLEEEYDTSGVGIIYGPHL